MNRCHWQAIATTFAALTLSACGGGGDSGASTQTPAPTPTPTTLSADQSVFESLVLSSTQRSYQMRWNLNLTGAQVSGTNYLASDHFLLAASPLSNGAQTAQQSASTDVTSNLVNVLPTPTRVLKNGQILVVPGQLGSLRVSYVGNDVQVDTLADDAVTVAYSQRRQGYSRVNLTGTVVTSPTDLAQWHNSLFANPAVLSGTATYLSGAAYIKFSASNVGDRYNAFDCTTATTGASITPCRTATTLNAALTTGLVSNSDGRTYLLADGAISTVGGVPIWVATAPRPVSATLSSTLQYRIYFELSGNVYTGALIRDGQAIGGSYHVSNPAGATVADRITTLPFHIRMNKAAHDSLVNALAI
ncbi:hypothetical protein EV685_0884 [Sphaerotilus mobilis]|uniref:Lipoprotein n=2 Tax=Sphaerotilus mobilis TaxID=47994 RepID=A0A4Q7LXA9_9BURK|nr:hypothetical protein EV685_0884 [Sphaerotilus mobilis]